MYLIGFTRNTKRVIIKAIITINSGGKVNRYKYSLSVMSMDG